MSNVLNYLDRSKFGLSGTIVEQVVTLFDGDGDFAQHYKKHTICDTSGNYSIRYVLERKPYWLTEFSSTLDNDGRLKSLYYDFSAKILGQDYLIGINSNNINTVISALNEHIPCIKIFNPDEWLNNAYLFTVEIGKNISLNCPVFEYLSRLYLCNFASNYIPVKKSNGNITVKRSAKKTEVLTLYDKNLELLKNKMPDFISSDTQNLLRIELKLNSFSQIRKFFNLQIGEKLTLFHALHNDFNVVAEAFTRIIKPVPMSCRMIKCATWKQNIYNRRLIAINNECDGDVQKLRSILLIDGIPKSILKKTVDNIVNKFGKPELEDCLLAELSEKISGSLH